MKIKKIALYQLKIPFSLPISHSLASRDYTQAILVRSEDESGISGFGEGTPRSYVTGESLSGVIEAASILAKKVVGKRLDKKTLIPFLAELASDPLSFANPSAWCAIELSLLDLWGRLRKIPVWKMLEPDARPRKYTYSAVIPMVDGKALMGLLSKIKTMRMTHVKIKVGDGQAGLERLKKTREVLGPEVDIRIDGNGAFNWQQALDFLYETSTIGISAFEQPVPKHDIQGLRTLTNSQSQVSIIVDESLCSISDAKMLIEKRACHGFNMRLSKCGGLLTLLRIWDMAKRAGLLCQIGCHVGETAILSAAGRHLATLRPEHPYLEGSFSQMVLKEDLSTEPVTFGPGGTAKALTGPGLGIKIHYKVFSQWAHEVTSFS